MGTIKVKLLTSGIYEHMKRAGTQLFERQSKNRTFFKIIELYFDLAPRGANPRARQRSENPIPGATRMCKSPGVARGEMVRLGID